MNLSVFSKQNLIEYLVAFFIFLSIPPYFVWGYSSLQLILVCLLILLSIYLNKGISKKNFIFGSILFILYSYFAIRDGKNIFGILSGGLLSFIVLFPSVYLFRIFDKFSKLYSLILLPSIIVFLAVLFLDISFPFQTIPPLNPLKDYYYIQYPFLLIPSNLSEDVFRFMAFFDEPGVVGTLSGAIILVRGINFKKWDTYPILVSGILSLSLAFYLMLFAYIMFFQSIRAKIISICLLVALAVYFYNDDFVNKRLFERIKIENGQLAGVNRTVGVMDSFMNEYINSEKFWWGYGEQYAQNVVNRGGASYKDLIINYGILGFLLFVLISWVKGFKELGRNKVFLIYIVVFISIIYQRPFIFSLIYFFFLYIPIFYLKEKQNKSLYHHE